MRKENEKNQGETERWKSAAATKFIGNTQGGKNNKTLTQYPAYGHNFYAASSEETKKKKQCRSTAWAQHIAVGPGPGPSPGNFPSNPNPQRAAYFIMNCS